MPCKKDGEHYLIWSHVTDDDRFTVRAHSVGRGLQCPVRLTIEGPKGISTKTVGSRGAAKKFWQRFQKENR